jgi:hypothetical protein
MQPNEVKQVTSKITHLSHGNKGLTHLPFFWVL